MVQKCLKSTRAISVWAKAGVNKSSDAPLLFAEIAIDIVQDVFALVRATQHVEGQGKFFGTEGKNP